MGRAWVFCKHCHEQGECSWRWKDRIHQSPLCNKCQRPWGANQKLGNRAKKGNQTDDADGDNSPDEELEQLFRACSVGQFEHAQKLFTDLQQQHLDRERNKEADGKWDGSKPMDPWQRIRTNGQICDTTNRIDICQDETIGLKTQLEET